YCEVVESVLFWLLTLGVFAVAENIPDALRLLLGFKRSGSAMHIRGAFAGGTLENLWSKRTMWGVRGFILDPLGPKNEREITKFYVLARTVASPPDFLGDYSVIRFLLSKRADIE